MSTIAVNAITDASGGSAASINGYTPSASNMTGRNRIINGAMMIDQRNAGASVNITTSNIFGVDRWKYDNISSCTYTAQQSSIAPIGFPFSSVVTVGTGAASGASSYVRIIQNIEGFNTADLMWGTANAKTVTLSFWVRSSITGTYCVGLQNATTNYSYPVNYTINSANTWEYKTVTISGPTSGTWIGATNAIGILVTWDLGSGSNWDGTNASWQSSNTWKTSSQTALTATSGATFYITGVQLEVGSTASEFEHRLYPQELALCQRYYQKSFPQGTAPAQNAGTTGCAFGQSAAPSGCAPCWINFPVVMRATPTTFTAYNPSAANASWRNLSAGTDVNSQLYSSSAASIYIVGNTQTVGQYQITAIHYTVEAEL